MRRTAFLVVMITLLPVSARAGGDCELNAALSDLKTERHTTLTGSISIEEIDRRFKSYEHWLKIRAWIKPGDEIYRADFRDGIFRTTSYIVVRDGCVRRSLLASIT